MNKKRISYLINTLAHTKYLSLEPMITEVKKLSLNGIDWVIVGGESGPGARPIQEKCVTKIRDNCIEKKYHFSLNNVAELIKK